MPLFPDKKKISRLTISRIKALIEEIAPDEAVIEILNTDTRAGVRALAGKLEKRKHRKESLRKKQENMLAIERDLRSGGKKLIAGVDEAGRGPLAGPVVSGAVILPENVNLYGLDDSKKMTPKHREEMFGRITAQASAWGIGMADNDEINAIGILEATMKAMRTAVENLHTKPDIVLIDGNRTPGFSFEERSVVNGDSLSLSIAAASVIAKVSRDRMMVDMDSMFPGYGFARHKGYGAGAHIDAIRRLGPCDIHRFSFKIVPDASPPGTVSAILKKRLQKAPNFEFLERIAAGIARIREHLSGSELAELRNVYRKRRDTIKKDRINTGAWGEDTGCDYLIRKGYSILDRNWRAERYGYEIDIVAQIDRITVFCEVKTAKTGRFGDPVSWVTPEKTHHIAQAASEYIAVHDMHGYSYRFDVIGLQVKGESHEIIHIENAFSAPEGL